MPQRWFWLKRSKTALLRTREIKLMPYQRVGKCVYKKKRDGSKGEKKGCSSSASKAKKYLKRLYSVEEIVKDELMKVLGEINEATADI